MQPLAQAASAAAAARRNRALFLDAEVAHVTDAPVIAVVLGERGYNPIDTPLTAGVLNDCVVPPHVAEAALAGSMFGWDVPAARDAVRWFRLSRGEYIA